MNTVSYEKAILPKDKTQWRAFLAKKMITEANEIKPQLTTEEPVARIMTQVYTHELTKDKYVGFVDVCLNDFASMHSIISVIEKHMKICEPYEYQQKYSHKYLRFNI